jgi:hypothetical protein
MVLRNVFTALIGAALLAWNGLSMADEYRPGEFLGLDLSEAVLSPKQLGPPSEFVHVPVEARADRISESAPARALHVTHPNIRVVHARVEKPRGAARTKLARRHSNPLDAQALDTRIQVWPCKSGGICGWKR